MTTKIRFIAVTAAIAAALTVAPAAVARPAGSITVAQSSLSTLHDIEGFAVTATKEASELQSYALNPYIDPSAHRTTLLQLKHDVNKMGVDLASLEARRLSLDPAEQHTIDAVLPLLKDTAGNLEAAIRYFNENRARFWTPEYRAYTDRTEVDLNRILAMVRDCRKFEKAHATESHLEKVIGLESH